VVGGYNGTHCVRCKACHYFSRGRCRTCTRCSVKGSASEESVLRVQVACVMWLHSRHTHVPPPRLKCVLIWLLHHAKVAPCGSDRDTLCKTLASVRIQQCSTARLGLGLGLTVHCVTHAARLPLDVAGLPQGLSAGMGSTLYIRGLYVLYVAGLPQGLSAGMGSTLRLHKTRHRPHGRHC